MYFPVPGMPIWFDPPVAFGSHHASAVPRSGIGAGGMPVSRLVIMSWKAPPLEGNFASASLNDLGVSFGPASVTPL